MKEQVKECEAAFVEARELNKHIQGFEVTVGRCMLLLMYDKNKVYTICITLLILLYLRSVCIIHPTGYRS
jgi:hypothetical protein